jgi:xanthine dehydrogenase molybdenum-binding subunit
MSKELLVVGKSLPRKDALTQVKGEMKFVTDMYLPRMLCVKFLRSPYAHAKIIRIDTSRAEALPGVEAVFTNKNVPRIHPNGYKRGEEKFEFLLDETVHYAGEEVAVVAGGT